MNVVSHNEKPPQHLEGKDDLKLVAYVWWCGDEFCDCTEPVIAWQTRRTISSGVAVYDREAIWTGTFVSHDCFDPDDPDPNEELAAECARRGIIMVE